MGIEQFDSLGVGTLSLGPHVKPHRIGIILGHRGWDYQMLSLLVPSCHSPHSPLLKPFSRFVTDTPLIHDWPSLTQLL